MKSLSEKTCIVTGAATGIGRACAERLHKEGANVVITDIGYAAAKKISDRLGHPALAMQLDVTNQSQWMSLVSEVQARFDKLDILVNNAGTAVEHSVSDATDAEWKNVIDICLTGTFLGCKATVPLLRKSHTPAIINISSVSGLKGDAMLFAYNAAKGGVTALTRELAVYFAKNGDKIRVNAVHPGTIQTDLSRSLMDGNKAIEMLWTEEIPLGRLGSPDDIASMVRFLASEESSFVTGASYVVDGGASA